MNELLNVAYILHLLYSSDKIVQREAIQNPENDFWDEYSKVNHVELNLPIDIFDD